MSIATDEKITIDIGALKEGIDKCGENIQTFEKAIDGELATIKDYKRMIRDEDDKSFDNKSLEGGVVKCEKNIQTFEGAIDREHTTIREHKHMIRVLEGELNDRKNRPDSGLGQ